jgi:hypothetical protein
MPIFRGNDYRNPERFSVTIRRDRNPWPAILMTVALLVLCFALVISSAISGGVG